ncbi:MAG TPA: hypothetical protein VMV59_02835, partial [Candidatus Dormibacteraeota bacterium]|nr:hypothetical protein [Candidatus Dormibacteraeota bacterium]
MKRVPILTLLFFIATALPAATQNRAAKTEEKPLPSIEQKVAGMEKLPGFFTYYWDAREGKIWLQVDKWDTEFLYVESLPNGVGSNDI